MNGISVISVSNFNSYTNDLETRLDFLCFGSLTVEASDWWFYIKPEIAYLKTRDYRGLRVPVIATYVCKVDILLKYLTESTKISFTLSLSNIDSAKTENNLLLYFQHGISILSSLYLNPADIEVRDITYEGIVSINNPCTSPSKQTKELLNILNKKYKEFLLKKKFRFKKEVDVI